MTAVAVLGAGAWGTALANCLALAGREPILWSRDPAQAAQMSRDRENAKRLPGVRLADSVTATADPGDLARASTVLVVVPTQSLRDVLAGIERFLAPGATLVLCAKGMERGTRRFPSEVARDVCHSHALAVLSGPSFADDVARGLPTAVTLACDDLSRAAELCRLLGSRSFRPYASSDIRGVEIGGAAKNVLAIACGIAEGRGLGASARAALTARGFAELARFGTALGARPETLAGLSGLGDLLLTCSSAQSRNFALGLKIGRGSDPAAAVAERLAEGAWTAPVLVAMAYEHAIEMPIAQAVDRIIAGRADVPDAIEALLARPPRVE